MPCVWCERTIQSKARHTCLCTMMSAMEITEGSKPGSPGTDFKRSRNARHSGPKCAALQVTKSVGSSRGWAISAGGAGASSMHPHSPRATATPPAPLPPPPERPRAGIAEVGAASTKTSGQLLALVGTSWQGPPIPKRYCKRSVPPCGCSWARGSLIELASHWCCSRCHQRSQEPTPPKTRIPATRGLIWMNAPRKSPRGKYLTCTSRNFDEAKPKYSNTTSLVDRMSILHNRGTQNPIPEVAQLSAFSDLTLNAKASRAIFLFGHKTPKS
mmetsp:Transcript_122090/g.390481  ORF Transcript_122090/g.390481 Transcript_122090/m.390481 type:complete len:271 (+) Transcript_122090:305-1117(+)